MNKQHRTSRPTYEANELRALAGACPQCASEMTGEVWVQLRRKWRMYCTDCGRCVEEQDGEALIAAWQTEDEYV